MSNEVIDALLRGVAERRRRERPTSDVVQKLFGAPQSLPTRVFISFEYDNGRFEAAALGEQLRSSPRFQVQNWSLKEVAPQRGWPVFAHRKLNRSDVMVIVLTGGTYRAPGVLTEIQIARALGVPIRQIYPQRTPRPPRLPCPGAPVYRWTHENLASILDVPRRRGA